jgi:hypothetical protein
MARFEEINANEVLDNDTDLVWAKVPTAALLWGEAVAALGSGKRVPTLAEMKDLIDGQRAVPADFAAAFGESNAPVEWYWVNSIDPARENVWQAGPQTQALAEALSLEKPGHVSAWFNWQGNQPRNRRILEALLREVE